MGGPLDSLWFLLETLRRLNVVEANEQRNSSELNGFRDRTGLGPRDPDTKDQSGSY